MKPENLEEEGRCPALAALVGEGWKLYGPAGGFRRIFRCLQPACRGHDRAVPVFWGICYSCLYSSDYSYEYHKKDGYLVKTWPPYRPQKGSMFEKAQRFAIAGTVDERGKWFSPGLPVTAFDFDQLLELAVHEAENRSAVRATEPSSGALAELARGERP